MGLLHEEQRCSIQQIQGIQSLFNQIMAENSLQMNSKSYAKNQGLRWTCPLLIIHNRMVLQKGRIELSWKLQEQCLMIAVYVQNCNPHRVLKNKTPEEVFSSKRP